MSAGKVKWPLDGVLCLPHGCFMKKTASQHKIYTGHFLKPWSPCTIKSFNTVIKHKVNTLFSTQRWDFLVQICLNLDHFQLFSMLLQSPCANESDNWLLRPADDEQLPLLSWFFLGFWSPSCTADMHLKHNLICLLEATVRQCRGSELCMHHQGFLPKCPHSRFGHEGGNHGVGDNLAAGTTC